MLIERLKRELLGTRFSRNDDRPGTYPDQVFHGHMACLINANSASDGDIFPARFKAAGLGPLIGKRSWGGVIGITDHGPLIDGGGVNVPEFGTNGVDGSWIIEGYGVDPDIVVENDPKSLIEGRDPQLERGVAEVLRRIEENPPAMPQRPPAPIKTEPTTPPGAR
jgi:tricorn protease